MGGEVAEDFAFQAGDEGFGGLAEFKGFDGEAAAAAHDGQRGDDGGECLGFDKIFDDDVGERVGGDLGGREFVEVEGGVEGEHGFGRPVWDFVGIGIYGVFVNLRRGWVGCQKGGVGRETYCSAQAGGVGDARYGGY